MRKNWRTWVLITTVILSMVVLNNDTELHEEVHEKIFLDYGIPSEVHVSLLDRSYTKIKASELESLTPDEKNFLELGHEINEAVSYNIQSIKYFLMMILIVLVYIAIKPKVPQETKVIHENRW